MSERTLAPVTGANKGFGLLPHVGYAGSCS
jgi:hypothetical protein